MYACYIYVYICVLYNQTALQCELQLNEIPKTPSQIFRSYSCRCMFICTLIPTDANMYICMHVHAVQFLWLIPLFYFLARNFKNRKHSMSTLCCCHITTCPGGQSYLAHTHSQNTHTHVRMQVIQLRNIEKCRRVPYFVRSEERAELDEGQWQPVTRRK